MINLALADWNRKCGEQIQPNFISVMVRYTEILRSNLSFVRGFHTILVFICYIKVPLSVQLNVTMFLLYWRLNPDGLPLIDVHFMNNGTFLLVLWPLELLFYMVVSFSSSHLSSLANERLCFTLHISTLCICFL